MPSSCCPQIATVRKRELSFIDFPKILSEDGNGSLQFIAKDGNPMMGLIQAGEGVSDWGGGGRQRFFKTVGS